MTKEQQQTRKERLATLAEELAVEIGNNALLLVVMEPAERALLSAAQRSAQATAIALKALT